MLACWPRVVPPPCVLFAVPDRLILPCVRLASQDVPVEVQKTWFEDVVTASTELRTITMGLRCMLEYFHDCTVPLGLSDCLEAVARGARMLVGGRRARVFLVREADNGTQYLWSETRRRKVEEGGTGAGAGAGAGGAQSSSFKQGRRAVRLPMPTYIPDEDLIRTPGALPPMLQRVERAAAQLGQTPGFVGLSAMSRRAFRVGVGSSREHPVSVSGACPSRGVRVADAACPYAGIQPSSGQAGGRRLSDSCLPHHHRSVHTTLECREH